MVEGRIASIFATSELALLEITWGPATVLKAGWLADGIYIPGIRSAETGLTFRGDQKFHGKFVGSEIIYLKFIFFGKISSHLL